jgi:hypothetical protein
LHRSRVEIGIGGLNAAQEALQAPFRQSRRGEMAKSQKKSNKETRKPKKEVKKTIAANPSTKGVLVKD